MKDGTPRFPTKRLPDGRALLNLGSSARCAPGWNHVDFSWIVRLGRHRRLAAVLHRWGWLSAQRYERILRLDPDTVLWDLRKGIPFPDRTFDAIYHSHLLEHIDREAAPFFIRECLRVLKPGGELRVVTPDLEALARNYLDCVSRLPYGATMAEHSRAVEEMIDQLVARVPRERRTLPPILRAAENIFLGDTSRTGALHRWMYDRFSLEDLLGKAGFANTRSCDKTTSGIEGWMSFNLDTDVDGSAHKPGSLYVEGTRP